MVAPWDEFVYLKTNILVNQCVKTMTLNFLTCITLIICDFESSSASDNLQDSMPYCNECIRKQSSSPAPHVKYSKES